MMLSCFQAQKNISISISFISKRLQERYFYRLKPLAVTSTTPITHTLPSYDLSQPRESPTYYMTFSVCLDFSYLDIIRLLIKHWLLFSPTMLCSTAKLQSSEGRGEGNALQIEGDVVRNLRIRT